MLKHFAEAPVELLHIRAELTGLQLTAHQLHMNLTGGSLCGSSYPNDPSDPKEKLKNMNRERKKITFQNPQTLAVLNILMCLSVQGGWQEDMEAGSGIWVFLTVPYVSSPLKVIFQICSVVSENCFRAPENILIFSLNLCMGVHSSEHSEGVWHIRLVWKGHQLHTRTIQATVLFLEER